MAKRTRDLTTQQREKELIKLIEDAQELGFNGVLIKEYQAQLNNVQKEIRADKENLKSYSPKRVRDTKPSEALNKPLTIS